MQNLTPIKNQKVKSEQLIFENIPLADKNWFRTGGNAKFYAEPKNGIEFQQALFFAKEHNQEIFILGKGANILISDNGFDGLVLCPKLNEFEIVQEDNEFALVKSGAGADFSDLINFCLENNIVGLEEFSGIPGTVGGSVFINIHYFEFLLSQFIESAQVIEKSTGAIKTVDKNWFEFGYNYSTLHKDAHYLLNATFKLKKVDDKFAAYSKGRRDEIIRHRQKRYPISGTCGSFFRNFFEHEIPFEICGKKIIFVAYYLDKIGVKGQLKVNDAIVSYQHANMIVNVANAKTADIIELAKNMQKLVYEKFGILPQPECRLIGFKEYPLYPINGPGSIVTETPEPDHWGNL
ncbi:UDP-N-acetylmuramate dehydrogenase [Candidatus Dependentiae bacterium]|nr:UDP-N-acetylmuramate dehydrogenase [Candidatus Dependentiae bacterium]